MVMYKTVITLVQRHLSMRKNNRIWREQTTTSHHIHLIGSTSCREKSSLPFEAAGKSSPNSARR